jgi:4'-phosphopantetheinyl transferase EntD
LEAEVASLISRPEEQSFRIDHADLLRFTAKEAFFKAYYPAARVFLDFNHVRIELNGACSTFLATLVADDKPPLRGRRAFEGHFAKLGGHYLAALWIPA